MPEQMYDYLKSYLSKEMISGLRAEMKRRLPYKGLLLNRRRFGEERLLEEFPGLSKDRDSSFLFRFDPQAERPGKSILHEAGAYYILDPSSAEAAGSIPLTGHQLVLDMCAAPGGKTVAAALASPESLIVANDASEPRARELAKNIERLGLPNVIVTSFDPKCFLGAFKGFFSRIILDAPCSGTGMFRKEAKMADDWTYGKAMRLVPIQDDLLNTASELLAPGGKLLYATCSFLEEEDENRVKAFLAGHGDFLFEPAGQKKGYLPGKDGIGVHLLPNLFPGEGHYFSLLGKEGTPIASQPGMPKADYDDNLGLYCFQKDGDKWGISVFDGCLTKLRALRTGIKLTDNSRFAKLKADHALSHFLLSEGSYRLTEKEALAYLHGDELKEDRSRGSYPDGPLLMSYENINLGYGLKKGARIRNCYPKGLRKNLSGK